MVAAVAVGCELDIGLRAAGSEGEGSWWGDRRGRVCGGAPTTAEGPDEGSWW